MSGGTDNLLQIRNLSFAFGKRQLWSGVDIDMSAGSLTAILGNNGTGKSTLLNCIGGILRAQSGSVFLNGQDLLKLPRRERARRVGYVAQHFETSGASVYDTVLLGRLPYFYSGPSQEDYEVVERVLQDLAIASWSDRSAKTLSGGEAQKVMLARAIVQQTDVLLLDEPTASLDLGNQVKTLAYVSRYAREHGTIVLMVSHDINAALRFCSQFVLIDPLGVVTSVASNELTERHLSQTYGIEVRLCEIGGQRLALVESESSFVR